MKKINWGKGILIAFGLFVTFILSFVYRVQSNPEYDNELVVEEYYKRDMRYSEEMEKMQRAAGLKERPQVTVSGQAVELRFPVGYVPESGTVSLYRPSSGKLDFDCPLRLEENVMVLPAERLAGGRWNIAVEWQKDGQRYLVRQQLYL